MHFCLPSPANFIINGQFILPPKLAKLISRSVNQRIKKIKAKSPAERIILHPSMANSKQTENIFGADHPAQLANFNRLPQPINPVNQSLLCFCNFGPPICELENACIKHDRAACFHSAKQEIDPNGDAQMQHLFGCAPLERGADGSHLTCNSWRSRHSNPQSISCCYQGNLCNRDLPLPVHFPPAPNGQSPSSQHQSGGLEAIFFVVFGFLLGFFLLLAIFLPIRYFLRKGKAKKMGVFGKEAAAAENGNLLPNNPRQFGNFQVEDSGSGSGGITLNQRTIALDLEMLEVFARGRYGELRKAVYRGSMVAVKIFYTTEEESWRNEREIYLSQMLNHENILQYVAADIMSSLESMTQMILVVDFHPLGSLYDYLRADFPLNLQEALGLAFTTISGIEHLHNPVQGTGGRRKPEIAHRDIKSKNVLVKRPFVCCLADFGLAVRLEEGAIFPQKVNVQVGTKRYMAPELLADSLNPSNFEEFKWADIYSFSLVLWEIMNRIEPSLDTVPTPNANKIVGHQRLMSHSNSSGFVSASDSSAANAFGTSCPSPMVPFIHRPSLLPNSTMIPASSEGSEECSSMGMGPGGTKADGGNGGKRQQQQHSLPFQSIVENDPTLEQMRDIVCLKKIRPPMKEEWTNGGNNQLKVLGELMGECWREQGRSRHTALKLKKELARLVGAQSK